MRKILTQSAAVALVLGIGACASKPKPVEEVYTPPVQQEAPTQVAETPAIVNRAPVSTGNTGPINSGPLAGSLQDFRVNVGERVYFDLAGYRLDGDDQEILQRQAAWLASNPGVRILVAGNCDERGTREYNLALGERRASVVKDYLVGLGVDPARVDTISYGKERPVADGHNEQAWAANRNGWTQLVSGVVG